jgi:tRNA threonylcarbamoyladenosine biosynthesis protein TsaE
MEWLLTLENLDARAKAFWKLFPRQKVFAFHGQLGAGKTTFIHRLCRSKSVTGNLGSPSFSIINEYLFPGGKIFHIDLYRLQGPAEAVEAGVEDCLYSGEICLLEWPERAPAILPEDTVHLTLHFMDEKTRRMELSGPPQINTNSI